MTIIMKKTNFKVKTGKISVCKTGFASLSYSSKNLSDKSKDLPISASIRSSHIMKRFGGPAVTVKLICFADGKALPFGK